MTESPTSSCGSCKGFNYCFWAKLIVAIPAVPLMSALVASYFAHPWSQLAAAGVTAFLLVYLAVVIDRMKVFSGKIRKCNK